MLGRYRLVFVSLLSPACVGSDDVVPERPTVGPDFDVRYQTKYVDIAPSFNQPICQGSLSEIDTHIEAVAGLLDIDVQERMKMFWYSENAAGAVVGNEEICLWCSGCGGCFEGTAMHVNLLSLHHELVHAIVVPAWGRTDRLFEEGVAYGLDRGSQSVYSVMTNHAPMELVGSDHFGGGHFARWLIDRYGATKFSEMFEPRLNLGSTSDEVFAAVEDVYGMTFEELQSEYFDTAPTIHPMPGLCDGLLEVPWNADRWELDVDADCNAPHMFGPNDAGSMFVVAVVDIPAELNGQAVATWIPSNESAVVWPCLDEPAYDADPELVQINYINNNGPTVFRSAGRHRIELPVQQSGPVYLRLCEDNGTFPGAYPLDKTVDPKNCVGD